MNRKKVILCSLSLFLLISFLYAKDYFINVELFILAGDTNSTTQEIENLKLNKKIKDDDNKHKIIDYEQINNVLIAYDKYVIEYEKYIASEKFQSDYKKIEREYNLYNNNLTKMGTRLFVGQPIIDLLNKKIDDATSKKQIAISLYEEANNNRRKIIDDEMTLKYKKINEEASDEQRRQIAEQEQKTLIFLSSINDLNVELQKLELPPLNEKYDIYHFIDENQKNNNLPKYVGSVFWTMINYNFNDYDANYDYDSNWKLNQTVQEYEIYTVYNEIGFMIAVKSFNKMPIKGQKLQSGIYKFTGIVKFQNSTGGDEIVPAFEFITNKRIIDIIIKNDFYN